MTGKRKSGFFGGIHPTDGSDKALTDRKPIRILEPDTVTIYLNQSLTGGCKPLVKEGEQVVKGQLIARSEGFARDHLHASVTGRVEKITEIGEKGSSRTAFVIARLGEETEEPAGTYQKEFSDLSGYSREEILERMMEGGLVGMGGAGFPTYKKYDGGKLDWLLINGAECEPFLTCDHRLMLEEGYRVLNGVRLLLKASGAKKAYICMEENKQDASGHLQELMSGALQGAAKMTEPVEIRLLPVRYPQGGERQLIQTVLGVEVPQGGLPASVGAVVSNVGTAAACADAVLGGKPLTHRIVTVTGLVKDPGNYRVPIGTPIRQLLDACGGVTAEKNRVIIGGPMTGNCVAVDWKGEELPFVTKTTSGVVVLPEFASQEQPCIRCGGCERVCPAGLIPYQIDSAYRQEDFDLCEKLYASECIACGCCSYTCPARRELTWTVRAARDTVKQRMRERKAGN